MSQQAITTISTAIACGYPLEEAISRIASLGVKEVDLLVIQNWAHINPSDLADNWEVTVKRIEDLITPHGMKVLAFNSKTTPDFQERSPEANSRRQVETQAILRLMEHLGTRAAAIQPPLANEPWPDVSEPSAQSLREVTAMATAAGRQFALELHSRSPFETMEQVNRLLEHFPECPFVYDPTHFIMTGMPVKETTWMMEKATHCHIRDAAKGKIQAPFGEGEVDFDWVLSALRDHGYNGIISIEYLGGKNADFDVVDSARRLYDKIAEYFPVAS